MEVPSQAPRRPPTPALPPMPPERGAALSLRARLLVPVLMALIPAFLLLVHNALEDREAAAQRTRWRAFGAVSSTVAEMGRVVDATAQLLGALAELPEARRMDGRALEPVLAGRRASHEGCRGLELADPSGRRVAGAGEVRDSPEHRDLLERTRSRGRPALRLEVGDRLHRGELLAAAPVRDRAGRIAGTLSAAADLDWLYRRVTATDLPEDSELVLGDLDGRLVLRHPYSRRWLGQPLPPELVGAARDPARRSLELAGLDGLRRVYRVSVLRQPDGAPFGLLAVGVPLGAGEAQAGAGLVRDLLLLSLVALVSLGTAWIMGEWLLLRRLRVLSRTIHQFARLDLTARTGLGRHGDEIGRLAWSFDVMAERLERSRHRETSILESAGEAICGLDETGRILFANRAAGALLGVRAAELPGLSFQRFLSPDGGAGLALGRTLQDGSRETAEEVLLWRADETLVPVDYTSTPMENAPGQRGAVVVLRDVSERTRARAEVEEAHRRVLHAAREKKAFYREVLDSVTGGRFHLVDPDGVPSDGLEVLDVSLEGDGYSGVRHALPDLARRAGLPEERSLDLVVLFGEAASNAIKHGVGGRCRVYLGPDRIRVRVYDQGPGIRTEQLPATLFESGYSTKVSLGMGYTMMLQMADALWLATGPEGTVLQIEVSARPVEAEEAWIERLMARF